MKIKQVGSNMTELHKDGIVVLFSYETPVAAYIDGECVRTEEFYSPTTTRHINKWLAGVKARTVPQQTIEDLL